MSKKPWLEPFWITDLSFQTSAEGRDRHPGHWAEFGGSQAPTLHTPEQVVVGYVFSCSYVPPCVANFPNYNYNQ